jgi:glycosyltransferase involved in cell wall biosynthesis
MKKLAFYFDASKLGEWEWSTFLNGEVGMSGTDGQFLLLVNEMSDLFKVYFYLNEGYSSTDKLTTVRVQDLSAAALDAKHQKVDLLIFNNKGDDSTREGIKTLNTLDQPFIMWDHNGPAKDFEDLLSKSSSLRRIVCVSKAHANWHRHKRYFNKVTFIYNGKDYAGILPTNRDEKFNIGYLGAVDESKGFHWVAKAWPKVKSAIPNASLTVIGSIKTHDRTRKTGDLGIAAEEFETNYIKPYLGNTLHEMSGVNFTGHISPKEMVSHFRRLNLGIVNPNIKGGATETFCVSAIDFQGHGIPVIGGNAGGLRETVQNRKTGILINNSEKLADAIIGLVKDKRLLLSLTENCSKWVIEKFSRREIISEWINLIEAVLAGREPHAIKMSVNEFSLKAILQEIVRWRNNLLNNTSV